ncbi:hypothetical protein DCAR_0522525 [Daucus carota subsp. sativus]|uniref:Uncharacterized protein n=1 Tax=Daucus carota subsp. sativus TaxID=79200 RepID=A0A164ZV19_DAUCS|nr:hypothetical protein DCAR_0522525 [Daucus carota subsp. sativus]
MVTEMQENMYDLCNLPYQKFASSIYSCLKDEYTNTHLKEDDGRMRIEVISGLSKDIWLDKNKQPDISFT